MLFGDLSAFLAQSLDIAPGTVSDRLKALRASELIATGRQGPGRGARMDSRDAVNGLLACVLDHRRGDDVSENVQRARGLRMQRLIQIPLNIAGSLMCFRASTAGLALTHLLSDMRGEAFARWTAGEPYSLTVSSDVRGRSLFISLSTDVASAADLRQAAISFGKLPPEDQRPVERHITMRAPLFERLAKALGPPDG